MLRRHLVSESALCGAWRLVACSAGAREQTLPGAWLTSPGTPACGGSHMLRELCSSSEDLQQSVVLDVRSAAEARQRPIAATLHVPIQELPERLSELPDEFSARIEVICGDGRRSTLAASFLQQIGYTHVEAQPAAAGSGDAAPGAPQR